MTALWVRPAPGKHLLDPRTMRLIPEQGDSVPWSSYWVRRIARGEALLMDGPPSEPVPRDPKKEK